MKKLTMMQRRLLLSIHILFSIALVGHVMVDLPLVISALNTSSVDVLNASYLGIKMIGFPLAPISAAGTMITGILLCLFTNWGLFKHYWIVIKDVLTLLVIPVGILGIDRWTSQNIAIISAEGMRAVQNPVFIVNNEKLITGLILQLTMLSIIVIISVFKPSRSK